MLDFDKLSYPPPQTACNCCSLRSEECGFNCMSACCLVNPCCPQLIAPSEYMVNSDDGVWSSGVFGQKLVANCQRCGILLNQGSSNKACCSGRSKVGELWDSITCRARERFMGYYVTGGPPGCVSVYCCNCWWGSEAEELQDSAAAGLMGRKGHRCIQCSARARSHGSRIKKLSGTDHEGLGLKRASVDGAALGFKSEAGAVVGVGWVDDLELDRKSGTEASAESGSENQGSERVESSGSETEYGKGHDLTRRADNQGKKADFVGEEAGAHRGSSVGPENGGSDDNKHVVKGSHGLSLVGPQAQLKRLEGFKPPMLKVDSYTLKGHKGARGNSTRGSKGKDKKAVKGAKGIKGSGSQGASAQAVKESGPEGVKGLGSQGVKGFGAQGARLTPSARGCGARRGSGVVFEVARVVAVPAQAVMKVC